jgi:hypothetical protein
MKIAIHGTNSGYRIIYPKQQIVELFDVRSDNPKQKAIGKQAYSIHFSKGSVIFSKYKIVRDYNANSRTGNIAFSVIISDGEKLTGEEIQMLLNELAENFEKHIKDDNFGDIQENWDFVTEVENKYKPKLKQFSGEKNILQYTKEAAFIYYSTEKKLQEYLDLPYKEKYYDYKQIFFVDEGLKNKDENPLNALRHSENDLTEKIDFPKNDSTGIETKIDESKNPSEQKESEDTNDNNKHDESKTKSKSKSIYKFVILGIILFVLFGGIAGYEYKRINEIAEQVIQYVKGDEFFLNKLEDYEEICKRESFIIAKNKCDDILPSIKDAIDKRKLINEINFMKLIELNYLSQQKIFEETIKNIDTTKYEDIKKRLGNVSNLPLKQIADSINKINTVIATEDSIKAIQIQQEAATQSAVESRKLSNNSNFSPLQQEIINYLNGSDLKENKLNEYLGKAPSSTLKNTIKLYLEFWNLEDKPGSKYNDFFNKFKGDKNYINLKDSKLNKFLDKMSKENNPKYDKQFKRENLKREN